MMKWFGRLIRIFVWLAIIAGVLFAAGWFGANPGNVSVLWRGLRIDLSVTTAALAMVALCLGAAILTWLLMVVFGAPGRFRAWRSGRKRDKALLALSRGFTAIAAGDARGAKASANRVSTLEPDMPLGLLLRAQAAQLTHDRIEAGKAFAAMQRHPETEFLGIRGMLLLASRGEAPAGTDTLALAERAHLLKPEAGWAADTLFDLKARAGAFDDAEAILKRAVRKGALTSEESNRKRAILWHQRSVRAEEQGFDVDALRYMRHADDLAPTFPPVAARLASLEIKADNLRRARAALERALGQEPHPELVSLYASLEGADEDPLKRVARMERLLKLAPQSPDVLIGLADAAMKAGLWGVARGYLEQARTLLDADAPAGLFRRFAELEIAEHGDREAETQWLRAASEARSDEAWTCRICGASAHRWRERCNTCGTFDGLEWRSPGRVTAQVVMPEEEPADEPVQPIP
jgi:HemY protein